MNVSERFWSKVDKTESCWLWRGGINENGYGRFWFEGGMRSAHRFSFVLDGGTIPDGLELDHLCRVRHCVNPAHLEPVTRSENNLRSPLIRSTREQCSKGHEFTPANTYVDQGRRKCRICLAASRRARRREASQSRKGMAIFGV